MLELQRPQQAAIARCLGNLAALRDSKGYEYAHSRARSSIRSVAILFGERKSKSKRRFMSKDSKRLYHIVRQACNIYLDCPGSKPCINVKEYPGRLPA